MTSIYADRLADLRADRTTRIKLGLSTDGIDKSIARFEALDHCATCGHYREWHECVTSARICPATATDTACELYTTERASDLNDDGMGHGLRARGGLVYFG